MRAGGIKDGPISKAGDFIWRKQDDLADKASRNECIGRISAWDACLPGVSKGGTFRPK